uniref:Uncharacterized protein n=1 Tax=Peronospora matthiolae TaxID=2874970 RepID=A0AAV1T7W7_9STRA
MERRFKENETEGQDAQVNQDAPEFNSLADLEEGAATHVAQVKVNESTRLCFPVETFELLNHVTKRFSARFRSLSIYNGLDWARRQLMAGEDGVTPPSCTSWRGRCSPGERYGQVRRKRACFGVNVVYHWPKERTR